MTIPISLTNMAWFPAWTEKPIGFVTWDPRNRPEYVEIGHNGIRENYKGRGYGRLQLEEAIRRIRT